MVHRIRHAIDAYRYRRTIRDVREGLAFFGCSVEHLSDAELEACALRMAELARQMPTAEEVARAFRALSGALTATGSSAPKYE